MPRVFHITNRTHLRSSRTSSGHIIQRSDPLDPDVRCSAEDSTGNGSSRVQNLEYSHPQGVPFRSSRHSYPKQVWRQLPSKVPRLRIVSQSLGNSPYANIITRPARCSAQRSILLVLYHLQVVVRVTRVFSRRISGGLREDRERRKVSGQPCRRCLGIVLSSQLLREAMHVIRIREK